MTLEEILCQNLDWVIYFLEYFILILLSGIAIFSGAFKRALKSTLFRGYIFVFLFSLCIILLMITVTFYCSYLFEAFMIPFFKFGLPLSIGIVLIYSNLFTASIPQWICRFTKWFMVLLPIWVLFKLVCMELDLIPTINAVGELVLFEIVALFPPCVIPLCMVAHSLDLLFALYPLIFLSFIGFAILQWKLCNMALKIRGELQGE